MRRIGRVLFVWLVSSAAWAADVQFYQTVDQTEVGLDETFQLTVVSENAEDAEVRFPATEDFEVLSKSQSTQMSYSFGSGLSGNVQRTQRYVLVMRANREGKLTIPPSVLLTSRGQLKTQPITMTVKKGRVNAPRPQARPDPFFGQSPFPGFPPGFGNVPGGFEDDLEVPRSETDLFIRTSIDREEVFVGEQVGLSVTIFSRVDISSVGTPSFPKFEGFWSEQAETLNRLNAQRRLVNGVPYNTYTLHRRILFPVRAGNLAIGPVEADITTGFMFAGHTVHRKGNELTVKVKALPPGAPAGFSASNVGRWRLFAEMPKTEVELGQPATVRIGVEGEGNYKNLVLPPLTGPSALRIFDPTSSDAPVSTGGRLAGRRFQEYLVTGQQTGTFVLPGLSLVYFDPETGRYETTRTEPLTLTVMAGVAAASAGGNSVLSAAPEVAAKNVLSAGGVRGLRVRTQFAPARAPAWRRPFFVWPVLLAPMVGVVWGVAALVRASLTQTGDEAARKKKARAARRRLRVAEGLRARGSPADFYSEVHKAVSSFLEAHLGVPVSGLTQEGLRQEMVRAQVPQERQRQILEVLEGCEAGRFAPGADPTGRGRTFEAAAAVMAEWGDSA